MADTINRTRTVEIKPHTRSLPAKPSFHDALHRKLAKEIGYRKPYRRKAKGARNDG